MLDHAAIQYPNRKVISRSIEGPIVETNYKEIRERALKVAQRLVKDGIKPGDRVGTLAWNTWRHLEAWYGILGAGAVYHTVNPRLFPDQLVYIINHAEDRVMMIDLTFVPLFEKLADKLPKIERYIVLTDKAHMPETTLKNAVPYEEWLAEVDGNFKWVVVDENAAAGMCYTSGTTGNPKGVVYSHRSNILHSLAAAMPDVMGLSSSDTVLPVVPMFHANSWSLAFSAPMTGAIAGDAGRQARRRLDLRVARQIRRHHHRGGADGVADAARHLEQNKLKLPKLNRVLIGGSACPRAMIQKFQDDYGVQVTHAWGMTEMSPIGTAGSLKPEVAQLGHDAKLDIQEKQGFSLFTVEMKITDDENKELPWDGKTFGRLKVKGAGGGALPTSRARAARSSTRTASSTPATSPPSTRTAT